MKIKEDTKSSVIHIESPKPKVNSLMTFPSLSSVNKNVKKIIPKMKKTHLQPQRKSKKNVVFTMTRYSYNFGSGRATQ